MNIKVFRILSLLLLAQIIFTKQFILILYWIVLVASIEFLNTRTEYKQQRKYYTLIFFLYLLFITIVRTSGYKASETVIYSINVLEHLLFSIVISFKITLYLGLLGQFSQRGELKKYVIAALAFNVVGFINEIYQNIAKHKPPFIFSFGAKTDLLVNVVGSVVFLLMGFLYLKQKDKSRTANASVPAEN